MSNSTVPINEWPMQRIAAGIFVTIWGMVSLLRRTYEYNLISGNGGALSIIHTLYLPAADRIIPSIQIIVRNIVHI